MPPCTITSPKKKRSKCKGSDASGRTSLKHPACHLFPLAWLKQELQTVLHDVLATPMQGLEVGTLSGSHSPKGSMSLGSNIPVNPQAPEQACKGRKGHSKAVPLPYSSLNITNGPASSIDNMSPGFSMQQPGGRFGFVAPPSTEHSLQETHNTVGLKAVKKRAKKVASDQTPCNIVPLCTTFMEHQLDPALFKEDNNLLDSMAKSSSVDNSDGKEDEDREEDGEREEDESDLDLDSDSDLDKDTSESQYQRCNDHLGFSKKSLPLQPQVTHHLTPEFDFQCSRDEDDTAAQMSINKSTGSLDPPAGVQQQQCSKLDMGLHWKSFLEHTKGECRMEHALEDPFLTFIDDLPRSVTEVLIATLVAWDKEGKQFKAELKKTAIGLVPLVYSLIPPASVPPQECATWVESAASQLLAESKFLRFGLDELYNCVLDSLAKNGHGKSYSKFSAKEYSQIYCQMFKMINKILQHPYHGPKLVVQLQEWAEAGWQEQPFCLKFGC
ncbi:hypothetical protein BDR05DRAFT_950785 [Suillus weaverae]|nr:hypothetical protein BDR05DRAFT_950785 [Suillus weaverae]